MHRATGQQRHGGADPDRRGRSSARSGTADAQPLEGRLLDAAQPRERQGGFGLWSSSPMTAEFPTVYAAHFLVEAKDRGQKIPAEVLTSRQRMAHALCVDAGEQLAGRAAARLCRLSARRGKASSRTPALANVEQELTHRYPQAWPTDLAAAYLASTYRLMQRNADADRIVAKVPWATPKARSRRGDLLRPARARCAAAVSARAALPGTARRDAAGGARDDQRCGQQNQANSLSAAYTLLALDAFAKTSTAAVKLGITRDRQGRPRACAGAAGGSDAESQPSRRRAARLRVLEGRARFVRISSSTSRVSIAIRRPRR